MFKGAERSTPAGLLWSLIHPRRPSPLTSAHMIELERFMRLRLLISSAPKPPYPCDHRSETVRSKSMGGVRVEDYGGFCGEYTEVVRIFVRKWGGVQQKVKLACLKPEALDVMKLSHNPKCRAEREGPLQRDSQQVAMVCRGETDGKGRCRHAAPRRTSYSFLH